jgi:hypothetical protein
LAQTDETARYPPDAAPPSVIVPVPVVVVVSRTRSAMIKATN